MFDLPLRVKNQNPELFSSKISELIIFVYWMSNLSDFSSSLPVYFFLSFERKTMDSIQIFLSSLDVTLP